MYKMNVHENSGQTNPGRNRSLTNHLWKPTLRTFTIDRSKNNNNKNMPSCCLGSDCLHNTLALRDGHKCRICRQPVHSIGCSVMDDSYKVRENLLCLLCDAIRKEGADETGKESNNKKRRRKHKT